MKTHGLLQRLASMIGMNVKIEDFFDEDYLFNSEKKQQIRQANESIRT